MGIQSQYQSLSQSKALPPQSSPTRGAISFLSPATATSISSDINIHHLELLHHFEHETCKTVVRTEIDLATYRTAIVGLGLTHPFLMQQILALSALHLSLLRPNNATFYREMAATLQSTALVGFHEILLNVNASNCQVVLLFSHLVALQDFCDIFNASDENFNAFLDRLVGCIRLLRGVNLIIQTWWGVLEKTTMGSILASSANEQQPLTNASNEECKKLRDLIASADLSPTSIGVCLDSLDNLGFYYNRENSSENPSRSINRLFSWLVTSSSEYITLLDERRPEALVILACYAILLHGRRNSWAVGDAGLRLFNHIDKYLSKRWEQWLQWPKSVVYS